MSVRDHLQKRLNQHGYGFQYALIRYLREKGMNWYLEATEFPVEVSATFIAATKDTRIDFVFRYGARNIFLVAECKRANPALSNWCFVRAPEESQRETRSLTRVVFEELQPVEEGEDAMTAVGIYPPYESQPFDGWESDRIYHLGLPVKARQKGDDRGESGDQIEKAIGQVLLGTNGLAEWISYHDALMSGDEKIVAFVPVVFTTAKLYTTEADIGASTLETGELDLTKEELTKQNWLYYQYYMSPGLLNKISPAQKRGSLSEQLHYEFRRTVAIVTPDGIEEFFQRQRAGSRKSRSAELRQAAARRCHKAIWCGPRARGSLRRTVYLHAC